MPTKALLEKDLALILSNRRRYPQLVKTVELVITKAAIQIQKNTHAEIKQK